MKNVYLQQACNILSKNIKVTCIYSGHCVNLPQVTTIDRFDCILVELGMKRTLWPIKKGSNSYKYMKNHIILESSRKCANGVLTALVYMIIDPYVKLCNLVMEILHFWLIQKMTKFVKGLPILLKLDVYRLWYILLYLEIH